LVSKQPFSCSGCSPKQLMPIA